MQFLSLDGVCQGPGAPDEDTTGGFDRGGWFVPFFDDAFVRRVTAWTEEADAFLFGRRTYQAFSQAWPKADPADPIGRQLNGRPKYVASHGLSEARWGPASILSDDVELQVAGLKRLDGRELQVHGSATLARALLAAGLVDELRLVVAPVVVGAGRRLFPAEGPSGAWRPLGLETLPGGLSLQTFERVGAAAFGEYRTG
jgi:dihydrofolate reductase